MNDCLNHLPRWALNALPNSALRILCRRQLVIALYHAVSNSVLPHVRHLYPSKTISQFESDLLYLKRYYNVVSYDQVYQCLSTKTRLPPRPVLVTFDDGFRECFSAARPVLLKHGMSCVFFVATNFVDNRKMFYRNKASLCIEKVRSLETHSWIAAQPAVRDVCGKQLSSVTEFTNWIKSIPQQDEDKIDMVCRILNVDVELFLRREKPYLTVAQLQTLVDDGFTIGGHSKSHRNLQDCSRDVILDEIVGSCTLVKEWVGQAQVPFAFPFYTGTIDRTFLADIVAKHHFIPFLFGTHGLRPDRPFLLNRVWLDHPPAGQQSSVPRVLRTQYQNQIVESLKRRFNPRRLLS